MVTVIQCVCVSVCVCVCVCVCVSMGVGGWVNIAFYMPLILGRFS